MNSNSSHKILDELLDRIGGDATLKERQVSKIPTKYNLIASTRMATIKLMSGMRSVNFGIFAAQTVLYRAEVLPFNAREIHTGLKMDERVSL